MVGGINGIDEAIEYLYRDYIPQHGYRVKMPIDFEKYCQVHSHTFEPDEIEVWVPIEENRL